MPRQNNSSDMSKQRRSRIVGVQKSTLINLVQNYFIRSNGHHFNANFSTIDSTTWQKIADVLNTLGPNKTAMQWKNTYSSMNTRVCKKAAEIRSSGANPQSTLTGLDLKIHQMAPRVNKEMFKQIMFGNVAENLSVPKTEPAENPFIDSFDDNNQSENFDVLNLNDSDSAIVTVTKPEIDVPTLFKGSSIIQHDSRVPTFEQLQVQLDRHSDNNILNDNLQNDFDYQSDTEPVEIPQRTVVINSAEELEAFISESATTDGVEHSWDDVIEDTIITDVNDIESTIVDETIEMCDAVETNDTIEVDDTIEDDDPVEIYDTIQIDDSDDEVALGDDDNPTVSQSKSSFTVTPSQGKFDTKGIVKTSTRIPDVQKERLVQLIQNDFLKVVGRFAGANGVQIKNRFWERATRELNTLGPPRSVVQWKATFDAIKASAKEKLANHHNENGPVGKQLNRLEEKIIAIYGLDNLDGNQRLGEMGTGYKKTVPMNRISSDPLNESNVPTQCSSSSQILIGRPAVGGGNFRNSSHSVHSLEGGRSIGMSALVQEKPRAASVEEEIALEEILREIRGETDNNQNGTESVEPQTITVTSASLRRTAPTSTTRNVVSKPGQAPKRSVPSKSTRSDTNYRTANGAHSGANLQNNGGNLSAISRIRDGDGTSAGSRITNAESVRGRTSSVVRSNSDEDDNSSTVVEKRDRSNLRNRYTSYDMVQRSIQQQELFIEQTGRNHAEMLYSMDRNQAQMIGMFTSVLKTAADVARDIFLKK